jgi:mRNA-degrading endonuclease RelE of RelBE toxin-antitoxin system
VIQLPFELKPSKRIEKQIGKLDAALKLKLLDLMIKLKETPVPIDEFNVVKLSGSANTYRIRIQKIRIIYDVYWKEKRIEILKVDKRKNRTYK